MPLPSRGSAANIVIRPRRTAANDDDNSLDARLLRLLDGCGSNKNDCAIAFITACIGEGLDTRELIVARSAHLGLNPKHVGTMLLKSTGVSPTRHYWRRDEEGRYTLLS